MRNLLLWYLPHVGLDPILSEGIRVMRTPFTRGGSQDVTCLKLELVNGWLSSVIPTKGTPPPVFFVSAPAGEKAK